MKVEVMEGGSEASSLLQMQTLLRGKVRSS